MGMGAFNSNYRNGMGWRDKVYFILNHYSEDELFNFVSSILGEESVPNRENFSFMHFLNLIIFTQKLWKKDHR